MDHISTINLLAKVHLERFHALVTVSTASMDMVSKNPWSKKLVFCAYV